MNITGLLSSCLPADTILLTDAASCKSTEVKSVFIYYNNFII